MSFSKLAERGKSNGMIPRPASIWKWDQRKRGPMGPQQFSCEILLRCWVLGWKRSVGGSDPPYCWTFFKPPDLGKDFY